MFFITEFSIYISYGAIDCEFLAHKRLLYLGVTFPTITDIKEAASRTIISFVKSLGFNRI